MVPSGGCVCSAGPSVTSQSWAVKVWITPGRDTSYDAFTWRWRWRRDAREVTPARASEDTQVSLSHSLHLSLSLSHSLHLSLSVCVSSLLHVPHLISCHQAGWWGSCTCRRAQLSSLTSGTPVPQCAAPLLMAPSEHGTSKMSVQHLFISIWLSYSINRQKNSFYPKIQIQVLPAHLHADANSGKVFFFVVHKTFCSNSTAAKSTKQLKWTWTIKRLLTPHPSQSKCLRPWGFRADLKIHYITVELVHPLQRGWALTYLAL